MRLRSFIAAAALAACSRAPQPSPPAQTQTPAHPAAHPELVGALTIPALPAPAAVEMESETHITAKLRRYDHERLSGYMPFVISRRRVTRSEPLAGGRRKVTYLEAKVTSDVLPAGAQPVEGKTYILDAGGGVAADNGAVVPPAELAIVRADAPTLEEPSPLVPLVAGKQLVIGVTADVPDETRALFGTDRSHFTRLSYLLKGKRGRKIVLGWTGAVEETWDNGLAMSGELVGEVLFDPAAGRAIEASGEGPVRVRWAASRRRDKARDLEGDGRVKTYTAIRKSPPASP